MSTSPVYWHPLAYQLAMRVLYGAGYEDRYRAILDVIPKGASVVDVCAGDCRIYSRYLKQHVGSYEAVEASPALARAARRLGIRVHEMDARTGKIPEADVVLLQASLYQFMPEHGALVDRLVKSARKMLVIAEPVRNLAQSENPVLAWIGRRSTAAAGEACEQRFDETMFEAFMAAKFKGRIETRMPIANGRELLFCVRTDGL